MDRSYRDFDAYLREIEQERQLERQDRCPPEIPVPFGALLVAIVVLPLAIPLFLWLSVTRITEIIADLVVFNHQTFVAFVRDKFEKGSPTCGGRLCSLFNWYTGLYVLINIVLVIGWALLVALYPVVGVMHTMVECAWRAYDESDMWEESLVAGLGDVVRLNKADKEACAEQIAQYCAVGGVSPGRWLLAAGDFFLLTGVFEGIKCIQPMLNLHQRLLGLVDSVLDQTNNAHSGLEVATTAGVKAAKTVQKAAEVLEELGIKIPEIRIPIPAAIAEALKRRIEVLTSMLNRALATLPGAILDLIREDRAQKFEAKTGARSAQKQTTGLVVSLLALVCGLVFWGVLLAHLHVRLAVAVWLE